MDKYAVLLSHPYGVVAGFLLICSTISVWIFKSNKVPVILLLVSISFGYLGNLLFPFGILLLPIVGFAYHVSLHKNRIPRILHGHIFGMPILFIFLLLTLLGWHFGPIKGIKLDNTLYINFNKAIFGIILILSYLKITRWHNFKKNMAITIFWLIVTISTSASLGYHLRTMNINPLLSTAIPIWLIVVLFFITIPEESFWKGFFLVETNLFLERYTGALSQILAATITAILQSTVYMLPAFGIRLFVVNSVINIFLSLNFFTSKSIESVILVRYVIQAISILLFSTI